MKKNQGRSGKGYKPKIELKIKSRNVTNNFILTTPISSPAFQHGFYPREDCYKDQVKINRPLAEEVDNGRIGRQYINNQIKIANTTIMINKCKVQEEQTGTQTPLFKKLSITTDCNLKKKTSTPLLNSERIQRKPISLKEKKKLKLSTSESGDINKKNMLQRVIAAMINDYKDGKIKQKQLEQTLVSLYQCKDRKKCVGKRTNKKDSFNIVSNQYAKSNQISKTGSNFYGTAVQKKKAKLKDFYYSQEEIYVQRVLQRKDFVNKIIIKGINTSLFLKEDIYTSNMRCEANQSRMQFFIYNINTSNSIKQINKNIVQEIKNITATVIKPRSIEQTMAIKIQRAWRRYTTSKILTKVMRIMGFHNEKTEKEPAIIQIIDYFTDEQHDFQQPLNHQQHINLLTMEQITPKMQRAKQTQNSSDLTNKERQFEHLKKLIGQSIQNKQIWEKDCLKNIFAFLNLPYDQQIIKKQKDLSVKVEQAQYNNESQDEFDDIRNKRIIMLPKECLYVMGSQQIFQEAFSNELDINSFTNKYSSKQVVNEQHQQYQLQQRQSNQSHISQNSFNLIHSETSFNKQFKSTSIRGIDQALSTRQHSIKIKRQKQIEELMEKLICGKITKGNYIKEKYKIDKWYKNQLKELKSIKNTLLKGCNEALKILRNEEVDAMYNQKSRSMLKCLSDKYLFKKAIKYKNFNQEKDNETKQKDAQIKVKQSKNRVNCEADEQPLQTRMVNNKKATINHSYSVKDSYLVYERIAQQLQKASLEEGRIDYLRSPAMCKQTSLDLSAEYKFEQIEKAINEDDEMPDDNCVDQFQNLSQLQSQKFIHNNYVNQDDNDVDVADQHDLNVLTNLINQGTKKKFKYLCSQDKEDICEFLFLDLILEMFTENMIGHIKMMHTIEIHITNMTKLKKISKGFKTSINSCKDYLKVLYNFIVSYNIGVLANMSVPMGPTASEMLKYMRDQGFQANDNDDNVNSTLVLPLNIFESVSKSPQLQIHLERYYDDDEKENDRLTFFKTALNINNKSLFDSLNEMLDQQRPYGVWGKPFPWKKVISLDRKYTVEQSQSRMRRSIDKTIEYCSYLCGILVDKQQSIFGDHSISEQYVLKIREDRLSKMLANDLIQNEDQWIFYDDEETQINMDISKFVVNKLIKETVLELIKLQMR